MKILFILPSNIGDIVLATPAIALLRQHHSEALFYLMVSAFHDNPPSLGLFQNTKKFYEKIFVYNKKSKLKEKIALIQSLRQYEFDEIIDLKNSFLPFLLAKIKIRKQLLFKFYWFILNYLKGYKNKYIACFYFDLLKKLGFQGEFRFEVFPGVSDSHEIEQFHVNPHKKIILISPGSKSTTKRWPQEYFTQLINNLLKKGSYQVLLVGDESDAIIANNIMAHFTRDIDVLNLAGKTTLCELYHLIKKAHLVITNDSAPLHFAVAADVPSLSIFGPSDYKKYAPPFSKHSIVKMDLECLPCKKSLCRYDVEKPPCMINLSPSEVLKKIYA